jgi:1-acyl-sn-glycerol-3-phosphate acyltransferase
MRVNSVNTVAFHAQLTRDGRYETPPNPVIPIADRCFGRTDTWYYLRLLGLVVSAGVTARRGRFDNRAWTEYALRTLRLVEGCRGRVVITDFRRVLARPGPMVYVSNHMSLLETFLLAVPLVPVRGLAVVLKTDLLRYPFFGGTLRAVKPIAVTRDNPRDDLREVMSQGCDALRDGRSLLVFPQSTRTPYFAPADFNSLGVKVARRAGVPVAPVAVHTRFMGTGRWFRDFGPLDRTQTVRVAFGEPLAVEGSGKTAQERLVRFITDNLRAWGIEIRDASPASPAL